MADFLTDVDNDKELNGDQFVKALFSEHVTSKEKDDYSHLNIAHALISLSPANYATVMRAAAAVNRGGDRDTFIKRLNLEQLFEETIKDNLKPEVLSKRIEERSRRIQKAVDDGLLDPSELGNIKDAMARADQLATRYTGVDLKPKDVADIFDDFTAKANRFPLNIRSKAPVKE